MLSFLLLTFSARPRTWPASRRRQSWAVGFLVCLMFLALTADRLEASRASRSPSDELAVPSAGDDPVTDQFLQRYGPLREDSARRHAVAGEIVTAAARHGLDPDLLFALVAVESRFNSKAVSRRGARGLGQLMYPTARAVAPTLVHRPVDLYNVRRNLAITARHLNELLIEERGDLRAALTAYHLGRHGGRVARGEDYRYVGLVCTHYASLKIRRGYEAMAAAGAES